MFEPRKATCPYLYKYSNADHLDWLRDILLKHAVYFPSHSELNDPRDGWPQFKNLSDNQVTGFLANGFIKRHCGADLNWLAREIAVIDRNVRHYGALKMLELMGEEMKHLTESNRIYSLSMANCSSHMWESTEATILATALSSQTTDCSRGRLKLITPTK